MLIWLKDFALGSTYFSGMKSKQKYFAALVAAHRLRVNPEQFQSNDLKAAQDQPNGGMYAALR